MLYKKERGEKGEVHLAIDIWRTKATNLFAIVVAMLYLPSLVLMVRGHVPTSDPAIKGAMIMTYVTILLCIIFHTIDYRLRGGILVIMGYTIAIVGCFSIANAPLIKTTPMVMPIITLVLVGVWQSRVATVLSVIIILFTSFVSIAPYGPDNPPTETLRMIWVTQSYSFIVRILILMILLDRFHHFLMMTLTKLEQEKIERRKLEYEIAEVAEEERRRLGLDIHDGLCQQLTGALLRCEALSRRLSRQETPQIAEIDALSSLLVETLSEARSVAKGLYSLDDAPDALFTAIEALLRNTERNAGIRCELRSEGTVEIRNATTAQNLYRIVQEALTNAVRHSHCQRIVVKLRKENEKLTLMVEDDGEGFSSKESTKGLGMRTMAYRAELLAGTLVVESERKQGTRVICQIPAAALTESAETNFEARKNGT